MDYPKFQKIDKLAAASHRDQARAKLAEAQDKYFADNTDANLYGLLYWTEEVRKWTLYLEQEDKSDE